MKRAVHEQAARFIGAGDLDGLIDREQDALTKERRRFTCTVDHRLVRHTMPCQTRRRLDSQL